MDRLACVDVPALPLQTLLRRHPDWRAHPAVVVDEDRPQGLILWVNEAARAAGVRPGQRYAQGLSLATGLRAGVVDRGAIEDTITGLADKLRRFSPHVEPARDHADVDRGTDADADAGVFWLDVAGLHRLYPSQAAWGADVRQAIATLGMQAAVVVGWTRFGTYAVARSLAGARGIVFRDRAHEDAAVARVAIDRIGLSPDVCVALHALGVRTARDFLRLPAAGLRRRFDGRTLRLHELALGKSWAPLQPRAPAEPARQSIDLDDAERDWQGLVFLSKRLIDPLLRHLAARGEAIVALSLTLGLDHNPVPVRQEIVSASPTLDGPALLELVRLRLENLPLPSGVVHLTMEARAVRATHEQLRLLDPKPRRDPTAAARAVARLRALFGNDAVVRARLRDGHLPEASFSWEPANASEIDFGATTTSAESATQEPGQPSMLVRRFYPHALPLPTRPRREPDGWLMLGMAHGPVESIIGPHRTSGGWWRPTEGTHPETERDYHFVRLASGACCWVYYDRHRQRWFLQGRVS